MMTTAASGTANLRGWSRWVLVLIIPFSALAFDTWLNTQRLDRDYEMAELSARLSGLHKTLDALKDDQARLQKMVRIEDQAPDLGLVKPHPNQIEIVYCPDPEDVPVEEQAPYAVAQLP